MAGIPFSPPDVVQFRIGITEQNFDQQAMAKEKQFKTHRVPIKLWNRVANRHIAQSVLQKSAAHRSSALRQGKFAEARSQNGGNSFAATKAAGIRASMVPVLTYRTHAKNSDISKRHARKSRGMKLGQKRVKLYDFASEVDVKKPVPSETEK